MRINIPVYSRMGPKVQKTSFGAYAKDPAGKTVWAYDGRLATGKGIYVCAAARSATMYMTKVLVALGYKIGHESVQEDGSVGYHLAVIKPENCFHQTRHPLKQISSMVTHKAWGFMEDVIDIPGKGLRGCMTYWLQWNELIESFAVWQYAVENLPESWPEFLDRIGHDYEPLPDIPTNTNSCTIESFYEKQSYKEFTWADLFNEDRELAHKIKEKAKEYGYESPVEDKDSAIYPGITAQAAQVASV